MIHIGFSERLAAGEMATLAFRACRACQSTRLWFADDTSTGLMIVAGITTTAGASPLVMGSGFVSARFYALPGDGHGGRALTVRFTPGGCLVELVLQNVDLFHSEARGVLELLEERTPPGSLPDQRSGGRYLPKNPPLDVMRLRDASRGDA